VTQVTKRPGLLHFGDNLPVLEAMPAEGVDLVYLDPPFNSNAIYNVFYRSNAGTRSQAQITAFDDTWHWCLESEAAYQQVMRSHNTQAIDLLRAIRSAIGTNDMMAYLAMMAVRLLQLHRVLKPAGSLYLHCDPTASHYLRILLDAIFGPRNFRNELVWKRSYAHNSARRWGRVHDTILFYTKGPGYIWNGFPQKYSQDYEDRYFRFDDGDGRGRYWPDNLTGAGISRGASGDPWRGHDVHAKGRHWAYSPATLERLDADRRIYWPPTEGAMPKLKRYLAEARGRPAQDVLVDIPSLQRMSAGYAERLGWPTQKPLELLRRIIHASSNPGDVLLDPFCGCGTATHAAELLGRAWIGIDITHLAITTIEGRLRDTFPGISYEVRGTPMDLDGARELAARNRHDFESWAVSQVDGRKPYGDKKGADGGVDGLIYFQADVRTTERAIISVKSGKVQLRDVRDLKGVLAREQAPIGVFLTLEPPTEPMVKEAAAAGFYRQDGRQYPRLQILTAEQLLSGKRPAMPPADTRHNPPA
jgi:DNA modification methylase